MSIHKAKSKKPKTLAEILFITWFCSLLWGGGIALAIIPLGFFWQTSNIYIIIFGLAASFFSPVFLGAKITNNWNRGLEAGLASFLVGLSSLLLSWTSIGFFSEWANQNWTNYFGNTLQTLNFIDDINTMLVISLTACSAIITVLVKTRQNQYREFFAGTIIGIGISLVDGMLLGKSVLKNEMIQLIWQIPLLIWVSIAYFSELFAGRSKLKDFIVWVFLILISVGLPFLITNPSHSY